MTKLKQKGIIGFQTVLAIGIPIGALFGGYFGNVMALNKSVNDTEKAIMIEINRNRLDIKENTTNIENIEKKLDDINDNLKTIIKKL